MTNKSPQKRVLALSSAGGHFVQLCRLFPAFDSCLLSVASTNPSLAAEATLTATKAGIAPPTFYTIAEVNRWQWWRIPSAILGLLLVLLRVRPDVIVTTGAGPGFLALRLGKLLGARTVWLDSIANADELSLSGQKAGRFVDLWLTQWPDLATKDGPAYKGAVL